jgi:hypothetical protein
MGCSAVAMHAGFGANCGILRGLVFEMSNLLEFTEKPKKKEECSCPYCKEEIEELKEQISELKLADAELMKRLTKLESKGGSDGVKI